jgi:hypothetical protein
MAELIFARECVLMAAARSRQAKLTGSFTASCENGWIAMFRAVRS